MVGVDVAKTLQWAQFTNYRSVKVDKTVYFQNNRNGFEFIVVKFKNFATTKFLKISLAKP